MTVRKRTMTDVFVTPDGSIWVFQLMTERAMDWASDKLHIEGWQWIGSNWRTFAADHRPAQQVVEAMAAEGLQVRLASQSKGGEA